MTTLAVRRVSSGAGIGGRASRGHRENATAACSYHGLDLRTVNDDIKLLAGVPAPC